ncbi:GntR family transcriptional regulator [Agrobacterium rubi]|uniref:GntR family transcriptional regulator n=1 Tax=Agrobacterium rubi TaxID=28099 RepID=A0AAE7R5K3_9HYPH|nr:GntR family transcriptional regulator [Agrobacterium rubi]NTE88374.1 GntR family transcriptional regulator [Agrobacterium rubi]NTF04140.1 GntR family transcriptional regulator [Agrobacterium rubi]NTF09554.1 GntR family transcriptional regulator [Agrobacterium rubi]NTF22461.1 GntR family transcriptional regulator [Agrobacterium rubi]NTF29318.1 GntR family transcriptional regulator [Agrobacterium rubi]
MVRLQETGEPYYLQIASRLRDMVDNLAAGQRLPSEPQLAKNFKVSRFTVAKAVDELAKDGLIVRKQGSGTFVAEVPLRRQPGYLLSFTEAVGAAGHRATHKVLAFRSVPWSPGLPYSVDTALILFDRLRYVDGMPVARHRSTLSAELANRIGLTEQSVSISDFSLYRHFEDHGLTVAAANERLIARLADAEEQELLGIAEDSVVVSVSRQTLSSDGMLLDDVEATYDARRYSYEARLTRQHETGNPKIKKGNKDDLQNRHADRHNGPRLGPWDTDGERR